jgi:hypothetical protein
MLSSLRKSVDSWTPKEKALFVALLAFALLVGAIGIQRPLFVDEAYSVLTASDSLSGVIADLRNDNSLPVYYLLLHGWIACFGISEIATRVPSIFFYIAGIFACYKLGEELSQDGRVSLYSSFFYAVSLQAIHLAQKVRMYSLLGLLAALSTLFFFRYFGTSRPGKRFDWSAYTLVAIIGSFVHVWFLFLLFAQIICYLTLFPRAMWRRLLASLVLSGSLFLLLWGRFFLEQLHNGSVGWMSKAGAWTGLGALLEFYGGKTIGTLILAAYGLLFLMKKRERPRWSAENRRAQWALLVICCTSIAVPLLISLFKPIYFPGRYTIIALPCLAVLLGWSLVATVQRSLLPAFAVGVMVLVSWVHVATRGDIIENSAVMWNYAHSDKHQVEKLAKQVSPGDTVVFTGVSRPGMEYYLRLNHYDRGLTLINFPAADARHIGWDDLRVDRTSLISEADELTSRLAGSSRETHSNVWIIPDGNALANEVLLDSAGVHFASYTSFTTALHLLR